MFFFYVRVTFFHFFICIFCLLYLILYPTVLPPQRAYIAFTAFLISTYFFASLCRNPIYHDCCQTSLALHSIGYQYISQFCYIKFFQFRLPLCFFFVSCLPLDYAAPPLSSHCNSSMTRTNINQVSNAWQNVQYLNCSAKRTRMS